MFLQVLKSKVTGGYWVALNDGSVHYSPCGFIEVNFPCDQPELAMELINFITVRNKYEYDDLVKLVSLVSKLSLPSAMDICFENEKI